MFHPYTRSPRTVDAIHVTTTNYRDVADWITNNLADQHGVGIVHPGNQDHGVPRLSFTPRDDRAHVGIPIPGYLIRIPWEDGSVGYQSDREDTFDAEWKPTNQ